MGMYIFNPVLLVKKENLSTANDFGKTLGYIGKPNDAKQLLHYYKNLNLEDVFLYVYRDEEP